LARHPPAAGNGRRAVRVAVAGQAGRVLRLQVPRAGCRQLLVSPACQQQRGTRPWPGRPADRRGARADRFQARAHPEPEELARRRAGRLVPFSMPREAARNGTAGG
jgi:hypothetical protein